MERKKKEWLCGVTGGIVHPRRAYIFLKARPSIVPDDAPTRLDRLSGLNRTGPGDLVGCAEVFSRRTGLRAPLSEAEKKMAPAGTWWKTPVHQRRRLPG